MTGNLDQVATAAQDTWVGRGEGHFVWGLKVTVGQGQATLGDSGGSAFCSHTGQVSHQVG